MEPDVVETARGATGEAIAVAFSRALRESGLSVPLSATLNFATALDQVGVGDRSAPYWAGRSTLVSNPEDIETYDRVFAAFWEQKYGEWMNVEGDPPSATLALDSDDEDEDQTDQAHDDGDDDIQSVRFSRAEILMDKDFARCTDDELRELHEMMLQLRFTTHARQSRRQISAKRNGTTPDLRRTIRAALKHQGEPLHRKYTRNSVKPRRLVLILDVSGSMEPYARAFLRFSHAAMIARGRVEAFSIGTRLTRLTRHLTSRDPDLALQAATPEVKDWSGGTRLGTTFAEFNDLWAIRGMARGAIVVVVSDGWDRGDPSELGEQMERLHRVTHQLIWVNPLKASEGYAPVAAGMAAALPHTDLFLSGHSYRTLVHLAGIVSRSTAR
ncbi:MAG: vWA domain-containing protein [Acidimicrobiales bacterium]